MKHKSNYLFFFLIFAICFGCQQDKELTYQGEEIAYYPKKDLSIENIKIDTLTNESFFYSGLGLWVIFNDSLTLLDKRLDSAYVFSDDLVHRSTYLGKGDGPNLLTSIILQQTVMGDYLVLLGSNYDYHLINKNWEIEKRGQLDFYHEKTPYEELLKNPKADYIGLYETLDGPLKLSHDYKGNLVFSVGIPHPDLNYLWHETYYREARILGKINPDDGKVAIQGRYSNIYNQFQFLSTLLGAPFTYLNADTYIQGYEADSILYKLSDAGEAHYTFGVAGKEMNIAYENFKAESIEEYDAVRELDRARYSYYFSLDYVKETGLLFRGYTKSNSAADGLQIYRDDTLIGDVEVPKDFRFVGYKAPYYYAEFRYRADKEEDPIRILRFELPKN
ncbi:hypothetical protein SAMN04489724_1847 [Algoriphagus locisalis]|uniref:Uncharacterized protein n=1 Tax=Algoriphagus locisalis TaxID=305507 RepID=A0A1I7AC81_9BACT|nr:hypothetical protein [Algoriphagus locisalis]SFT72576.1 hypothetical protein SAMN04489724_1847 [Algoriphagus locisalis]